MDAQTLIFITALILVGAGFCGKSFVRYAKRRNSYNGEATADCANPANGTVQKEISVIDQRRVKIIQAFIEESSRPPVDLHENLRVCRLVTHADHQDCLVNAFRTAQNRIIIVSPQLSVWTINGGRIQSHMYAAISRGVTVVVVTDDQLNRDQDDTPKRSAVLAKKLMEDAGAIVIIARGIHQKTLIIDNQAIADGSYNWLSAVRDANHAHHREERTNIITGGEASAHIRVELERIVRLIPLADEYKAA
jgi:phosphatidylserine/phosphatidylglycerophosphate/cardiolipin synthase-like enzyme